MKLDIVTQWVRDDTSQFPPDQSLADRSVEHSTCVIREGGCEAGGTKNIGCVTEPRKGKAIVVRRIILSKRRKSTVLHCRKTEVVETSWRGSTPPPGSVITSGACVHRGSLGT